MKLVIFLFIFFFLNLTVQAQAIALKVDNSFPEVGEVISISAESNLSGNFQVALPSGFSSTGVMNGAVQQLLNSSFSSVFYRKESGFFRSEGEYTIGPAKVQVGNKIYTSNKIVIKVSKGSQNQSSSNVNNAPLAKKLANKLAFGLIEMNKSEVYVGEAVKLNARVYSQFEPELFENYKEYLSKGIPDKNKIRNPETTNVELKNFQDKRFYSFFYDRSICFPAQEGVFTIEPFELTLGNFVDRQRVVSESAEIKIKPLPDGKPNSFDGSVGKISMERVLKKSAKKQGDVAVLSIVFSGYGNIHSIEIPELKLPSGMQLYGDPVIKEDFQFTEKGADGSMTIEYNIQMLDSGKLKIPEFIFSYFDLESEKYIETKADPIEFNVEFTPGFNKEKAKEEATKRLTSKKNKGGESKNWFERNIIWISMGLGLPLLFFLIFKYLKTQDNSRIDSKKQGEEVATEMKKYKISSSVDYPEYTINLDQLKLKLDDPKEYLMLLSVELDKWLDYQVGEQERRLSKIEKLNVLSQKMNSSTKIEILKDIFQKIDEARYGLPVDAFYCQQLQNKLENLVKI